ncbi:PAS domain S-box protein [Spirochaetota bacterium]
MNKSDQKIILLVDDEAIIAASEKKIIEKSGYKVIVAYTGENAIETIRSNPDIDLVLMDINLGKGIDGTVAAQEILKLRDIPVVFLSSHTEPEVVDKTEKITSYGYIVKKSGETVLVASIKMAFKLYESRRMIKEQEAFRMRVFESSRVPMVIMNSKTSQFIDCNPAATVIYGFLTREDTIGKTPLDVSASKQYDGTASPEKAQYYIEKAQNDGEVIFDWLHQRPDGTLWDANVHLMSFQSGSDRFLQFTLADISGRKRAEEALRKSEEKYAKVFMSAPAGICVSNQEDGKIIEANDEFARIMGYTRDEVIGHTSIELGLWYNESDREHIFELLKNNEVVNNLELQMCSKGGELLSLRYNAQLIELGEHIFLLSAFLDITEQKMAEEALRGSEERYRLLIENLPSVFWNSNIDGETIYISPNIKEVSGYSQYDIYKEGKKLWLDRIHPDDVDLVISSYKSLFTGEGMYDINFRIRRKDGEWIWLHDRANTTQDMEGELFAVGVFSDITEKKKAELELVRTEALLNAAIEQVPAGILIADVPDGNILIANPEALNIRGETNYQLSNIPFELHPANWQTYYPDGTVIKAEDLPLSQAALYGKTTRNVEVIIRRKDGEERWVLASSAPVRDRHGNIIAAMVVFPDITDFKKIETALKESEEQYKKIFQNTQVGLGSTRISDGKMIQCNLRLAQILGYKSPEECMGDYVASENYLAPNSRKQLLSELNDKGYVKDFYTQGTRKDGSPVWVSFSAYIDHEADCIQTVVVDVTDRIKAEEALKENEERFRSIFEQSAYAMLLLDEWKFTDCNNAALELFGYTNKEDILGLHPSKLSSPTQPDGMDSLSAARMRIQEAFKKGNNQFEWIHRRANGEDFFAEVMLATYTLRNKKMIMSIVQNITAKKSAEEELRFSEEKFSRAFKSSPNILIIFDFENVTLVDINDQFLKITGLSRNEVIGLTLDDLNIHIDATGREMIGQLIANRESIRGYEFQIKIKDSEPKIMSFSAEIIKIKGKECILSIMEDITENKELQKELSTVVEMERQRIGHDLHDDLGQDLTGATFLIQTLKQKLIESDYPEIQKLDKIDDLIRNAVMKTRTIAKMLSPVEIGGKGFINAIEEMASQIEKIYVISCKVSYDPPIVIEDNHVAVNLYYITREAVNNSLKHGRTSTIEISLAHDNNDLSLIIRDNGKGLQQDSKDKGMGLRIMQYRANLIGAHIEYINKVNAGFTVKILLTI